MKEQIKVMDLEFGYELYRDENYQVFMKTPDGEMKFIQPIKDRPLFIGLKDKLTTKDAKERIKEAEELVRQGMGKKYTAEELYRLVYPDENEFCKAFYKMSCRMKNFIDRIRENRGLIEMYSMMEERHPKAEEILKGAKLIGTWSNPYSPADVEIYKTIDGRYAIEFAVSYGDTFDIRTWIFNKKPSKKSFQDLLDIEEVEAKIRFLGYPEEFRCWECGRHVHFVDIEADNLQEKISNWLDRYCGC